MEFAEFVPLPDGKYEGIWSGYKVILPDSFSFSTKIGNRGIDQINFRVESGKAFLETKTNENKK